MPKSSSPLSRPNNSRKIFVNRSQGACRLLITTNPFLQFASLDWKARDSSDHWPKPRPLAYSAGCHFYHERAKHGYGKTSLQFFARSGGLAAESAGTSPTRPLGPAWRGHLAAGNQPPLRLVRRRAGADRREPAEAAQSAGELPGAVHARRKPAAI